MFTLSYGDKTISFCDNIVPSFASHRTIHKLECALDIHFLCILSIPSVSFCMDVHNLLHDVDEMLCLSS
jgi:hypothetical protein